MAQILSFRTKPKASSEPGHDENFLHHEDYTLSFQVTESGHIGLGNSLPDSPTTEDSEPAGVCSDWTNQEMADLFRVKRLLDAAGVPNELERGLTDEGDPWLVFCGQDGEVFIHLCRLEGVYVLDSPNIPVPLRGADFNGLIEAFTHRNLPRTDGPVDPSDNRVIRIRRGGKVQLHPSALLAALIWTLLLAAEDIVLMVPDAEEAERGLADLEALTRKGTDIFPDTPFLVSEKGLLPDPANTSEETDSDPRQIAAHELFLKENSNGLTLTQNSYGMGLSTIAIAFGFMAEQTTFDQERLPEMKLLMAAVDEALEEDGEAKVSAPEAVQQQQDTAPDIVPVELADSGPTEGDYAEKASLTVAEVVAETKAFTESLQQATNKIQKFDIRSATAARQETAPPSLSTAEPEVQNAPAQTTLVALESEGAVAEVTSPATTMGMTLSTLRTAFKPSDMKSYAFGETIVQSSFELTEETLQTMPFLELEPEGTTTIVGFGSLLAPAASESTSVFRSFSEEARSFMSHLLGKTDQVEMIALSNAEIILIDSSALSRGEIYSASWETSDGSVISMVGLRSEFQDFDLIA
jgi:hypothetical protein